MVAYCLVGGVVFGKLLAELQCNAPPHDSHTVHCVDQRFYIRLKNVALLKLKHFGFLLRSTTRVRRSTEVDVQR